MAYCILSEKVQRAILEYSSGSTVAHLNVREIRKLKLAIPPLALQREFAAFVAKVDKLAFAARKRCDKAKQLYKAKIQEYFG
jgi:restriction endonuclease S subunit